MARFELFLAPGHDASEELKEKAHQLREAVYAAIQAFEQGSGAKVNELYYHVTKDN